MGAGKAEAGVAPDRGNREPRPAQPTAQVLAAGLGTAGPAAHTVTFTIENATEKWTGFSRFLEKSQNPCFSVAVKRNFSPIQR
jgi:hypothetical protein